MMRCMIMPAATLMLRDSAMPSMDEYAVIGGLQHAIERP